jgi:DNA-binding transcriptional regulator YiaG
MTPNAATHTNLTVADIRALLVLANLTQATFAARIGVSTRTVTSWLAGTARMPYSAQFCLEVLANESRT